MHTEGTIEISDSDALVSQPDAWYRIRTSKQSGSTETTSVPVIAQPFEPVKVVRTEREERLVVRTTDEISGTYEEVLKSMDRDGRFLKPGMAKEVLAHFRHHLVKTGRFESGRETFEAYTDDDGTLCLPASCYPRPGVQADEYQAVRAELDREPAQTDWEAYRNFEALLLPKETAPAKAACAAAPFARLLRSKRLIVAAPYHLSTNHGVGKTKAAEAYSTHAWNVELQSGEDLASDFRFAHYLSGPGTTLTVDEAEKFDWKRFGANVKKALESDRAAVRGTKDLGMVHFSSRRIPIFTGNALPSLPGPTLSRLKVVRFNEERAKTDKATRKQFDAAYSALKPVGGALARAAVKLYPTFDALLAAVEDAAGKIEDEHGAFKDNRRAKAWGIDYVFLQVWEAAGGEIHKAPSVADFVRDVVAPVEYDTFSSQLNRLEGFQAWFAAWRAKNTQHDQDGARRVQGEEETFTLHHHQGRAKAPHPGFLVTTATLDAFNRDTRHDGGAQVGSLAELGRLVVEQYPVPKDAFLDAQGRGKLHTIGDKKQRAVFVPSEDPDVYAEIEGQTFLGQEG